VLEVHDGPAVRRGLEVPADRRPEPAREAVNRRPLDEPGGLERVDAQLERLGPVGPEAEAGDAAGLLGDVELVGPVAGESVLGGERLVDGLGLGVRKWMAGMCGLLLRS
jgi:hypothetical protein